MDGAIAAGYSKENAVLIKKSKIKENHICVLILVVMFALSRSLRYDGGLRQHRDIIHCEQHLGEIMSTWLF
jgi:hypothetical protein